MNKRLYTTTIALVFGITLLSLAQAAQPPLKVAQSGRYLKTGTGKPFFMVGRQINFTWGKFWQLLERNQTEEVEAYIAELAGKGINTLRIFAEDLDPGHVNPFEADVATGTLNPQVVHFLRTLFDIGDRHGIYFIVSPWETFYMGDQPGRWNHRWFANQYFTKGIISNPGEFYRVDNPNGLNDLQKRRLTRLIQDVIGPRKNVVLELLNEVDGEWQFPYIHQDRPGKPGRATWFPEVVRPWLVMMRNHVRAIGYRGILGFSTSIEFPAFPEERNFLFDIPGFDVFFYHPYVLQTNACSNWPCRDLDAWPEFAPYCDTEVRCTGNPALCSHPTDGCLGEDTTIQPARDIRNAIRFAQANSSRPYVDSENGPLFTAGYSADFTAEDDILTFRNKQWANAVSGSASSGIRHPQGPLAHGNHDSLLPVEMDDIQGTIAHFFTTGQLIDLDVMESERLDHEITLSRHNAGVLKLGSKDREGWFAMAYLVVDRLFFANGFVGDVEADIGGLLPHRHYHVEQWHTDGFHTVPAAQSRHVSGPDGSLRVPLHLNDSVALKITLVQPERSAATELTKSLAIGAAIHTNELGPITATWKEGGRTRTASGDVVIWGHFHAPPDQVGWGNPNNPEAFAKIRFKPNGLVDVSYRHASVPDIVVNSALDESAAWTTSRAVTTEARHAAQVFVSAPPEITPSGGNGKRDPNGYQITPALGITATFMPGTPDSFPAAWREAGRATTAGGDRVIWGFFYADPSDRPWGSPNNPELYVKIWIDADGHVNVDYFHVSSVGIQVKSRFGGAANEVTNATVERRHIRHDFR